MKATVLIDNISQQELVAEWGLSIWIEYQDKKILLDTGASEKFLENAAQLGIPVSQADYGVLSHAHFDHANGMEAFFKVNEKAEFYIRQEARENCYEKLFVFKKYIGIKKGWLEQYRDRIHYAGGDYELAPGIVLVPHKTGGLAAVGKKSHLYQRMGRQMLPDDFAHEQSLVFETPKGLVVFNSCSHGGADTIIKEVAATFPDRRIIALIGGFHLFMTPEKEVRALAARIRATGIERVYTGHCTGTKAFQILKEELGDQVEQLSTGLVMEF